MVVHLKHVQICELIMETEKTPYFKKLSSGILDYKVLEPLENMMIENGFCFLPIDKQLFARSSHGGKITEKLTRLDLRIIEGAPSWEGLWVGFPGKIQDLSIKNVGTPYLRLILFPVLDLRHRLQSELNKKLPCVYFAGDRFSEVFLRKFELLKEVIPHVVVLSNDLYKNSRNKDLSITNEGPSHESWTQMKLVERMKSNEGLQIKTRERDYFLKYLSSEVPCAEGTEDPERLDILGYDNKDHALIAFELKGEHSDRVQFENLMLQGLEHRNWLEKNKMAIKLVFDKGPKGRFINTKKRVRLFLGFYDKNVPDIFEELRAQAKRYDKFTEILFVRLSNANDTVVIEEVI